MFQLRLLRAKRRNEKEKRKENLFWIFSAARVRDHTFEFLGSVCYSMMHIPSEVIPNYFVFEFRTIVPRGSVDRTKPKLCICNVTSLNIVKALKLCTIFHVPAHVAAFKVISIDQLLALFLFYGFVVVFRPSAVILPSLLYLQRFYH